MKTSELTPPLDTERESSSRVSTVGDRQCYTRPARAARRSLRPSTRGEATTPAMAILSTVSNEAGQETGPEFASCWAVVSVTRTKSPSQGRHSRSD